MMLYEKCDRTAYPERIQWHMNIVGWVRGTHICQMRSDMGHGWVRDVGHQP